jgi:hypothetical protein
MAEVRYCALPECGVPFEPKSYNAKYHHIDCQKIATNRRLMEKYYENKERRSGKRRICTIPGCQTILSRYNDDEVCERCKAQQVAASKGNLLDILNHIDFREE